ncbi:MAG TPA: hypothetical protein ENN92_01565, partial [candidate division WWE3 bacterium]|nr:hypothetical protein [candidate division WWE3 bacterium]
MPNPRDEGEIPLEGRLAMIETSLKDEMLPNLRSLFEVPVDLPEHLESYKEVLEEAGGEIVELFSYPYKVIPFWKNMRVPRSWFEAFSDEVEPIFVVLGHFNTILENPETLGNGVSVDIYEENTGSAGMSGSSKKGKHPRGNSPDAPKTSTVVKFTSKESRISIGEVPVHGFSLIINHTPNPKGRGDVFTPLSFSMKFSDANGKEIMRSGVDAHRVGSQERDKTRAALIEVDSIPFPENSLFNAPCSKIETHHLPVKSLNALESPERDTAFQTLLAILAKNMADRLDALSGEKGSGILVAPEKVNLLRKPFRALMRVGRPKEEVSVVEGEPASAEETHFKNVLSSMEGLDSSIVSPEQYQTFIDGVFGGVEGMSSWILGDSPVEASLPEDALDVLKDPSIAKIVAEKPEDFCFPNDLKEYERLMLSVEENLGFSMDSDMETIIALQTRLQQLFFIRRVLTTDFESRGKAENPVIEV